MLILTSIEVICCLMHAGIPQTLISLIQSLYQDLVTCVRVGNQLRPWFLAASGVHQGCVIAPGAFATAVDWLLERSVCRGMNGISFGQQTFTDLDFADDSHFLPNCWRSLSLFLRSFMWKQLH